MFKGIHRQMYITDVKSEIFDKAVFLIKPGYIKKNKDNADMAKEANRIINEKLMLYTKKKLKIR